MRATTRCALAAASAAAGCSYRDVLRGLVAVWHHRWLTLRTSFIGVGIGMMPASALKSRRGWPRPRGTGGLEGQVGYGQGAIEGVIAETANNSKEGGGFLPTIALGIPSTSAMALVVAALAILGLPVGPR